MNDLLKIRIDRINDSFSISSLDLMLAGLCQIEAYYRTHEKFYAQDILDIMDWDTIQLDSRPRGFSSTDLINREENSTLMHCVKERIKYLQNRRSETRSWKSILDAFDYKLHPPMPMGEENTDAKKPMFEIVTLKTKKKTCSITVNLAMFDDEHVDSVVASMKVFKKWIEQEVEKYI